MYVCVTSYYDSTEGQISLTHWNLLQKFHCKNTYAFLLIQIYLMQLNKHCINAWF